MVSVESIRDAPWDRGAWDGSFISADGASIEDFTVDDVDHMIAYGETDDRWEGISVGIARLKDGRVIGWEACYGPTGRGFSCNAYGGTADIICGDDRGGRNAVHQ